MSQADFSKLSLQLRALVEKEVESGEKIVWMEQPVPKLFSRGAIPIVLFGIPWTAFAIFWTAGASAGMTKSAAPGAFKFFSLFGLPFILIGFAMLSSPFWARRSAKRSVYVITDRRAIIFRSRFFGSINIRSFSPRQLETLQRNQNKDGSGDVIFTHDVRRDNDGDRHTTNVGFMGVREVKHVEELIRHLARSVPENAPIP